MRPALAGVLGGTGLARHRAGALNLDVFFRCQKLDSPLLPRLPFSFRARSRTARQKSEVRNEIRGQIYSLCGPWAGISCGSLHSVPAVMPRRSDGEWPPRLGMFGLEY